MYISYLGLRGYGGFGMGGGYKSTLYVNLIPILPGKYIDILIVLMPQCISGAIFTST